MSTALRTRLDQLAGGIDTFRWLFFRVAAVAAIPMTAVIIYVAGRWLVQALGGGVTGAEAGKIAAGVVGLVMFAVLLKALHTPGELEVDN